MTKKCSICKRVFDATSENFWRNKVSADGLDHRCKSCAKEYQKKLKEKNPEKLYYSNAKRNKERQTKRSIRQKQRESVIREEIRRREIVRIEQQQLVEEIDKRTNFLEKQEHWEKTNPEKANDKKQMKLRKQNHWKIATGEDIFHSIGQRCNNPNNPLYPFYGGRGIKREFTKVEYLTIFWKTDNCPGCGVVFNDENRMLDDGRTIDRIDPYGNYSVENTRCLCTKCNSKRAVRTNTKRIVK